MDPVNRTLFVNQCDKDNENMKWDWGFANETSLANFDNIGVKI